MPRRDRPWLSFLSFSALATIAILALVFSVRDHGNRDVTIALEDNTTQWISASNTWTSIRYNKQLHISSAWEHSSGSTRIRCLKEGIYRLYFSIQPDVNITLSEEMSYHCRPCHLHHQLRATIQYNGHGVLHEIHSSRTHSDREARFMSKSILFHANVDDVLIMQFRSLCPNMMLSIGDEQQSFNVYPTSATLIISD